MHRGSFGMMVHWLVPGATAPERGEPITDPERAVDAFHIERFLEQFAESGADWLIFTVGQNTGFYASPNKVLEQLAGPGHCSQRDLVLEIATGVARMGKRFVAYLPAEIEAQSAAMHKAFGWSPSDPTQAVFQQRYREFIRAYALKFGPLLSGWWFDGCYTWDVFPNQYLDWTALAQAARAGNPDAALAFNDGSFCIGITQPLTDEQDYLSGEVEVLRDGKLRLGRGDDAPLYLPESRFVEGTRCQWHALTFIDAFWVHAKPGPMEPPLYDDDTLFSFVRSCKAVGGAVTLNAGIYQEGHISEATLAQLKRCSQSL